MNYLAIIQLVIQWSGTIKTIIDTATSNEGLVAELEKLAGPIGSLISGLGSQLFPKASPTLQKVGAVIAAFDPNFTKWLQAAINSAGYTPALIVDGAYGPKTTAGVEWVQQKLGITVDGIAGKVTEATLKLFLTKLVPGVTQK